MKAIIILENIIFWDRIYYNNKYLWKMKRRIWDDGIVSSIETTKWYVIYREDQDKIYVDNRPRYIRFISLFRK